MAPGNASYASYYSFGEYWTFTRVRMQQKHLPVHSGHALQSLLPQAHFTLHGFALLTHHFWHCPARRPTSYVLNDAKQRDDPSHASIRIHFNVLLRPIIIFLHMFEMRCNNEGTANWTFWVSSPQSFFWTEWFAEPVGPDGKEEGMKPFWALSSDWSRNVIVFKGIFFNGCRRRYGHAHWPWGNNYHYIAIISCKLMHLLV